MARSSISPLGALLAEIREEQQLAGRARGVDGPASAPAVRSGRELDLVIETSVVTTRRPSTLASARWPVSLLVHVALVTALVVVPLLRSEALPTPAQTRALVLALACIPVPLPPPPPAAPVAGAPRPPAPPPAKPTPPAAATFTAPVDVPERVVAPADAGLGALVQEAPAGEAGGLAGGVPGGIVGGVVGGVAVSPAPMAPVRVGGEIREPKKIRDASPVYPDLAVAARVRGTVILECIVGPGGLVTDVRLVRGIPLLNTAAIDAVKQWMYTPTLKDGVPVPVILTVTVRFDL